MLIATFSHVLTTALIRGLTYAAIYKVIEHLSVGQTLAFSAGGLALLYLFTRRGVR